jgi:hypothetical protein
VVPRVRTSGVSAPSGVCSTKRNISAAPWRISGVSPTCANVAAISSISPTQRYALGGMPGTWRAIHGSSVPWLSVSSARSAAPRPITSPAVSSSVASAFSPFVSAA